MCEKTTDQSYTCVPTYLATSFTTQLNLNKKIKISHYSRWKQAANKIMISIALWFCAATVLLAVVLYLHFKRLHQYWPSIGIPQATPKMFFGNLDFSIPQKDLSIKLYKQFKESGAKFGGIYFLHKKVMVPVDLELIKHILIKDFSHFVDHEHNKAMEHDPLSCHLSALEGETWKKLRSQLTPTFSSGKMKFMFQTMIDCTAGLEQKFRESISNPEGIDIEDTMGRFSTDVIGSCAFGLECNSLESSESEFRRMGKRMLHKSFSVQLKSFIYPVLPPSIVKFFKLKIFYPDVEKFLFKTTNDIIEYREKNNVQRRDFMQLLIQLRNKGEISANDDMDISKGSKRYLTVNEIAAQCFIFFVAGFETSSSLMSLSLYELARNQEVQDKVRKEVRTIYNKYGDKFTYEGIMEMTYLDQVLREGLRLYQPLPIITRECVKDYPVPGTSIVIKKGTYVYVPCAGIHNDEEYYPNPEKFDPDRFTKENIAKRHGMTWMPFGEGPRSCIASRFGLLESRIGVATILKDFKVTLNEKSKGPLKYELHSTVNATKNTYLNVTKV